MWWWAAIVTDVPLQLAWGPSVAFEVVDRAEVDGRACVVRSTWHGVAVDGGFDLHVDEPLRVHGCDGELASMAEPWALRLGPDGVMVAVPKAAAGLLVDDAPAFLERGLFTWSGQTLPTGVSARTNAGLYSPSTGQTEVLEVERRVDLLPWCSDMGPGSRCVALGLTRASAGAPLEGDLPEGAWRVRERWEVEPATLRPHRAERVVEVAGQPTAIRTWRFLSR